MKVKEIKSLDYKELNEKEESVRKELFNLKFQHAIGKLENLSRLRTLRRDVARILTEKRLKSLGEESI